MRKFEVKTRLRHAGREEEILTVPLTAAEQVSAGPSLLEMVSAPCKVLKLQGPGPDDVSELDPGDQGSGEDDSISGCGSKGSASLLVVGSRLGTLRASGELDGLSVYFLNRRIGRHEPMVRSVLFHNSTLSGRSLSSSLPKSSR